MLNNIKDYKEEGFTIIEVLIVLAIAALILVVVLIAVPNLQRNQRNSARKDEASRILTAANTYVSNNNGTKLTAGSATQADAILKEAGNLQQYTGFSGTAVTTLTADQLGIASGAVDGSSFSTGDALLVVQGAKCDTTALGKAVAGTARQIVILYTTEKSSGSQALCLGS